MSFLNTTKEFIERINYKRNGLHSYIRTNYAEKVYDYLYSLKLLNDNHLIDAETYTDINKKAVCYSHIYLYCDTIYDEESYKPSKIKLFLETPLAKFCIDEKGKLDIQYLDINYANVNFSEIFDNLDSFLAFEERDLTRIFEKIEERIDSTYISRNNNTKDNSEDYER